MSRTTAQTCWPLMLESCFVGHADCLRYLLEHDCPLDDDVLWAAVTAGHFHCVELLVTRGLPQKPLTFSDGVPVGNRPVGPDQLRCLKYVSDQQCPIHTSMLIWVAGSGDLDLVRLLHSRRVNLWAGAYVAEALDDNKGALKQQGVMAVPEEPEDAVDMWRVLQYGWAMGAPLIPAMEEVFRAKRAATRTMLLCFKAAARPSRQLGMSQRQRAALAVMGRMPIEWWRKLPCAQTLRLSTRFIAAEHATAV